MKSLQLHLVLALVAVFAAIGVRRRAERPADAEGVALVDCAPQRVELRGPRSVVVEPTDRGIVVTVGVGEGEVRFLGGRPAAELLDDVSGLHAIRSFQPDSAVDYGFGEERLRVRCADRTLEWSLGGAPPGSSDRYLRGDDVVHLIAAPVVRALEEAEVRLIRRELHDFEEADLARAELTLPDGHTLTMVQRFADDPNRRRWVSPDAPEVPAPAFDRLMGARRNLRADAGAEPGGEALGTMVFFDAEGERLDTLELVRVGEGPRVIYRVRTDALGWVRVPRSTGGAFASAIERLR